MSRNGDLTIEETFNLAIKNHQNNNLQDAQNYYQKVLKIDSNHLSALNNLGVLFKELNEYQRAKDCYKKMIKINPNYAHAHNNLGIIFKDLGENQKAKDCYEKAIEIDPNYTDSYNNLGIIFKELNEYQRAKDCYKKIIELNPNYAKAHNNLGVIFQDLGETQKAKSCYEKAIEIDPDYVDVLNNLGVIFKELGDFQKAKDCYEKAIKIDPNYINTLNNLGGIFQDLGEHQKARKCYEKAIEIDPNYISSINALANLSELHRFDYKTKDDKAIFKKLIISLFNEGNIKTNYFFKNAKSILFSDEEQSQLAEAITSNLLLSNKILQRLLGEELFHLMLQKSLLKDIFLEKLLTKLRYEILFNLENSNKGNFEKHFSFIISLAEQSWLNEYVYVQSEKEINNINKLKQKIENDEEINELEIAILGCYIPLNSSENIIDKLLNYKSSNVLFNDLINVQIKEPLKENELIKSIQSLEEIVNPISKKVQEQYEENPYPRWRCTNKILSKNYMFWFNREIKPNKIIYNNKFDNPNVLIAGCGTGSHPISATRYENANVLGVDLSLTSLAYAKRKTEELNIKNIEYLQADILQLKKLDRRFDIIESSGVLHHMEDPIEGLKVLLDILEPHGFLKLGLYSEIARRNVVKARELIREKNYKNTSKDIKICRQDIINQKEDVLLKKLTSGSEFYSMSTVRDLLFHVQEHRFTIPQISKILKDFNLEFLSFYFPNSLAKNEYLKNFPEDIKNTSLDNWHQFEKNNPNIFAGMYQFWVRKINNNG